MAFLQSGDLLENRYRIEAPIARGGMSTVYRCTDTRLGRLVAAKVMDARYAGDAVFAQRFRREALSMANLTHPNIVGVYDFNAEGEHIFLIMELIHGGTLRELLAERGPLPPHAAAAVMRDILTGLAVAHRAGLVHRDIKPDNALINQDHLVKLTDFGLVRAASAAQATGHQIVGTVAYLSPEQVNGDEIGPASDVYSAGILLFELLTGKTPFAGDTELAHAYQRLHTPVPQPSSLTPGTPKLFDELVATATSLDTNERFANAGEFLNALEDVSQELGLPAYTIPIPQHAAASEHTAVVPLQDATMVTKHIAEVTSAPTEAPAAAPTPEPAPEPAPVAETTVQPHVVTPPAPVAPGGVGNAPVPAAPAPAPAPAPVQSKPVTNRSKAATFFWSLFVMLLTAAIAVGAWWFGSGRYGEIPQVLGMDQVEAVAVIQEAGFSASTESVYSNEVPETQVVGTVPSEGERQVRGREVTVLVSLGQPEVPSFSAQDTFGSYAAVLSQYGLRAVEAEEEYSDDVPAGYVSSTSPAVGSTVAVDSEVRVAVSKGPAPTTIPNVAQLSEEDALKALEEEGLDVNVTRKFDAETEGGNAIGTVPAAGTTLPRGSKVTLEISTAVEIPDVVGMTRQEATTALAEAGIVVEGVARADSESGASADEVTSLSPREGTLVDPSQARVTLNLAGLVDVPRVIGSRLDSAVQRLEDAGFSVEITNSTSPDGTERVLWQSPSGGRAEPGSTIRLRVV